MNTHDKYKLPPLPEPFSYTLTGKEEGPLFHSAHMHDYGLACYRAAIEAERQARGKHRLGPFTLDGESYESGFRDINRPGHPCFLRVVWKMEDDERSPECEKVAHFVIDALNAADRQARGELRCMGTNCTAPGDDHSPECILGAAESQGWAGSPEANAARLAIQQRKKPKYFTYMINGHHRGISETEPPEDSYDNGTLEALYTTPQPQQIPECPLHCGWVGLHKIAVKNAAYLAKIEWPEEKEGVSVPRAIVMRNMDYLIQICRAMLQAAPEPKE